MTLETIQLDLATAARLVAAVDPGLRVTAVVRLAGGRNDSVFEVKTADAGSLVVKLYPREWRWMMKKERFALDLFRDHRVDASVPVVLAADDSEEVLPHSLLVMTKLEGRHPDSVDEQDVAAFNREAGALLATLHEIRFEGFGYVGGEGVVEPRATNLEYMRSQFERKLRDLTDLGGDAGLRRAVDAHVSEREELLVCPAACYCHNDCHEWNVLVSPSPGGRRISGLLDFENVVAGAALLDLAKTHYCARRRTDSTLEALAAGYGLQPDGWREALLLYVLYHALELWTWLASLGRTESLAPIAEDMRRLVAAEALALVPGS